jgi:hypothetical protein
MENNFMKPGAQIHIGGPTSTIDSTDIAIFWGHLHMNF